MIPSLTLPTLHPYGTQTIFYIVFYQHIVPNGTEKSIITKNNLRIVTKSYSAENLRGANINIDGARKTQFRPKLAAMVQQ
jgi:hypothetical protein